MRQGQGNSQESSVYIPLTVVNFGRHGTVLLGLILRCLSSTLKTLNSRGFGEVDAESTHVHAVEESAEAFVEAVQTLVQQLQVHHVGFQIGHAVCEFTECGFQGFEWDGLVGELGCARGSGG